MDRAETTAEAIAEEALAVLGSGRQIAPFSQRYAGLELKTAYDVTAALCKRRLERGERAIGRKIGFTNRTIWDEYNVRAPIWGYVYDTSVHDLLGIEGAFSLAGFAEPRIEPEIMFGLAAAPSPAMSQDELLGCIDWIAHGFEIVQSIFPNWKFRLTDTVAAYGLHGALLIGPKHRAVGNAEVLAKFEIDLFRNEQFMDHGQAENILGGPLYALQHLAEVLAEDDSNPPLAAGEIVTTGTLTRAFPISPGERWSTRLSGIALDGVSLALG
jgi:2-oxo-3-hexenedioate decarboxylase